MSAKNQVFILSARGPDGVEMSYHEGEPKTFVQSTIKEETHLFRADHRVLLAASRSMTLNRQEVLVNRACPKPPPSNVDHARLGKKNDKLNRTVQHVANAKDEQRTGGSTSVRLRKR
jgi:hypothetical protein